MNNFNAGYKGLPLTISVKSVYERSKYTPTENTIFRAHATLQVHYSGVVPVGFFKVKGQRYAVGVGFSDGEAVRIVLCDITPMTAKVLTNMADIKNQLRKDTPRGEITKETLLAQMETGDKAMATLAIAYMLCHEAHPTQVTLDGLNDIEKHISHDLLLSYVPTYVGLLKPDVMEAEIGKFLVTNEVIRVIAKLKPTVGQQFDSPITDVYMENTSGLRLQIYHHLPTHLPFSDKIDNLEVFGTLLLTYFHPDLLPNSVLSDAEDYRSMHSRLGLHLSNGQIETIVKEVEVEAKCKVVSLTHYKWRGNEYAVLIKDTADPIERSRLFWLYCSNANATYCYNTLSLFNGLKIDKMTIGSTPLNKIDYFSATLISQVISDLENTLQPATEGNTAYLNYALIKLLHCFPFVIDKELLPFIKGEQSSRTEEDEPESDKKTDTLCRVYSTVVTQIHARFNVCNVYQLMTDISLIKGQSIHEKFYILRDILNAIVFDGRVQTNDPRTMGYGHPQQSMSYVNYNDMMAMEETSPIIVSSCTTLLELTERLFGSTPISTSNLWKVLSNAQFVELVDNYFAELRTLKMVLNQTNCNLR